VLLRQTARSVIAAAGAAREARAGGSRSGRSYALTLLTPVRSGETPALAAYLRGLGVGDKSPLSRFPYIHFARWVVIDQLKTDWPGAPVPAPRLKSEYLLFTASLTGPVEAHVTPSSERYVERLPESLLYELRTKMPAEAEAIWGHCLGYPGLSDPEAFVGYLARSQLDTSLFHVGYPDVTVDDVRQALAARDGLVGFVRDHQREQSAERLQQAYVEEAPAWFPSR
jgi:hypothetical protein